MTPDTMNTTVADRQLPKCYLKKRVVIRKILLKTQTLTY